MLFTTKQIRWWRKYRPHITVIRMCSVEIGEVSLLIHFLPNFLFRRCCFLRRADTNSTRLLLSVQSPQPLWEVHHPCFARGVPPSCARFSAVRQPLSRRSARLRLASLHQALCTGNVHLGWSSWASWMLWCCRRKGGKGEKGEMPSPVSILLAMSPKCLGRFPFVEAMHVVNRPPSSSSHIELGNVSI